MAETSTPSPPTPGQLAGIAHTVDDLAVRIAEAADGAQSVGRAAMAAELWEAERALRTARRRLTRAQQG